MARATSTTSKTAPSKASGKTPGNAGRQGRAKSEATRARILDAAAAVLAQHGFAGTRLADVADAARVQAPAIYYYFTSRETLIEEVVLAGITRLRDHVAAALEAEQATTTPTLDRIDRAVEAHLQFALSESDYARAAIRNAQQLPDEARHRYASVAADYGQIWSSLVSTASAEGELRPDLDVDTGRMLVLGALNWAPEWWEPRRGSLSSVIAQTQIFVRAAIAAPTR